MTILTSRNQTIATPESSLILLEEWKSSDATEFVKRSLRINNCNQDALIHDFCERIGNHPLGLQQAVAYIIQTKNNPLFGTSYNISNFLAQFAMFDDPSCPFFCAFATFLDDVADKLKGTDQEIGDLALKVLSIMAYLDPNDITITCVSHHATTSKRQWSRDILFVSKYYPLLQPSDQQVQVVIEFLKANSIIKKVNSTVTIHRLVQVVTRRKLKSSNEDLPLFASLIGNLSNTPCLMRSEMTHVLSVWKYASRENSLVQQFPAMANTIFNRLKYFGMYPTMLNFAILNYRRLEDVLGDTHVQTLHMKHNTALALQMEGKWESSLAMYEEVLAKKKHILGEEDESTLATASNMSAVLSHLGRFDEAISLSKAVLESLEKTPDESRGPMTFETINTKHNFALALGGKGEIELALEMNKEVLEWKLRELGERHLSTLTTQHNIGWCLFRQRKYLEGRDIFENVFLLRREVLGVEHPDTLYSMQWLGIMHLKLENNDLSLAIFKHILNLREKVLSPNHPHTRVTKKWIDKILEKDNAVPAGNE